MSKNQKTYLLLLAVIFVWGAIGYQFFQQYNPSVKEELKPQAIRFKPQKQLQAVQYTIRPDYRDPFLGKLYKKPVPKRKKVIPKPKVVFPNITYNGSIKGAKKSYIISINGAQEVFQVKQTMKGITLVKANENEVILKYKGEKKKFLLLQ